MVASKAQLGQAIRFLLANRLSIKNADAARPEGQHWDLSANAYVADPSCDTGYHFDLNTYKCVPD